MPVAGACRMSHVPSSGQCDHWDSAGVNIRDMRRQQGIALGVDGEHLIQLIPMRGIVKVVRLAEVVKVRVPVPGQPESDMSADMKI